MMNRNSNMSKDVFILGYSNLLGGSLLKWAHTNLLIKGKKIMKRAEALICFKGFLIPN